jgi:tetratricopeptide (TPR) repeat protein
MAKDAGARFETCVEFVAALRHALEDSAGRTSTFRVARAARRSRRWPLVAAALAAGLAAGAVAAWFLVSRDQPQSSVVTQTVTERGTTVERTVASPPPPPPPPAPPPSPPSPPPPSPPAASSDPHQLNDQGFALMQKGDFAAAEPLLAQAVQGLQGAGPSDPYEAFANYNLGYTLLQLGRCGEAIPFLEAARHLEPKRHEPKDALKQARHC